jgi:hypothetical protein
MAAYLCSRSTQTVTEIRLLTAEQVDWHQTVSQFQEDVLCIWASLRPYRDIYPSRTRKSPRRCAVLDTLPWPGFARPKPASNKEAILPINPHERGWIRINDLNAHEVMFNLLPDALELTSSRLMDVCPKRAVVGSTVGSSNAASINRSRLSTRTSG